MPNEEISGTSIAAQCNLIKDVLGDIASQESGICIVAENLNEHHLTGFNNVIGPKVIITFVAEEPVGSDDVSELLGMTRRFFDILVQRGRILCSPFTTGLTKTEGPSKPFYDLLERIRDTVRSIEWPTPICINPCEYHGIKPMQTENWLLDSYIISISVMTQIGRIQFPPPQLGTGPWVQLDNTPVVNNLSY